MTMIKKKKNNSQYITSDYLPLEITEDSHAFSNEPLNELYDAIRKLSLVDRAVILLYLEENPIRKLLTLLALTVITLVSVLKELKND